MNAAAFAMYGTKFCREIVGSHGKVSFTVI